MLESDYTHAESPKRAPELPLRVFNKSQLIAALRQHSRPIVIEDLDLALPFIRMLRARLPAVGIRRYHSAEIEAHWHIGQYVLPGNVHRVIQFFFDGRRRMPDVFHGFGKPLLRYIEFVGPILDLVRLK
jgi:hypothetical protein